MKKGPHFLLITIGIILMLPVLFLGFTVFAAAFLPEKVFMRIFNSDFNQTVSPYPFSDALLPENPKACEGSSMRLYLPGNLEYVKTDAHGMLYTNANEGLMQTTQVHVRFSSLAASYDHCGIKPVYLEKGIWAYNRSVPENEYELWDFILNLTEDQYDEHWPSIKPEVSRAQSLYTTALSAKEKVWKCKTEKQAVFGNEAYRTKDIYHFENETAKGFVILREKEETVPVQYSLDLLLFDQNDLDWCSRAVLISEDMQLLTQIANSAEILQDQEDWEL